MTEPGKIYKVQRLRSMHLVELREATSYKFPFNVTRSKCPGVEFNGAASRDRFKVVFMAERDGLLNRPVILMASLPGNIYPVFYVTTREEAERCLEREEDQT